MTQTTLAEAFLKQLQAWKVKYLFGVIGDDILPFLNMLNEENSLQFIATANEAGAAFMASYYAKLTGNLGVCIASAPGTVNLLQGVADAFFDGAPVLALTGQVKTSRQGLRTKQYYNQQELYRNFSSYSENVIEPQNGIRLLFKAMSQALLNKTVSHLTVAEDLWDRNIEAEPAQLPALISGVGHGTKIVGDIDKVVAQMEKSKRPLIIVSKKGKQVQEAIKQLSQLWGAGMVTSQEAKGLLPDSLNNLLGGIGQAGIPGLIPRCDCVLLVGSASYEERFLPNCPVIQLEDTAAQIDDRYLWDSLAGNISHIVKTLLARIKVDIVKSEWLEQIRQEKLARDKIIKAGSSSTEGPIKADFLMTSLSQVVALDAIISVDEGSFMHWFDGYFEAKNQEILTSSYWRSMGLAVPAAIAAQLANKNKQVVALVGDGSMLMNLGEFSTAVKYNLPITVIVVRDHLYSLEKDKAQAKALSPVGLEVPKIEFSTFAKACGAQGFKVETAKELKIVLERALTLHEPVIVDVLCEDLNLPNI